MKDIDTIDYFIGLRSSGYTYSEIMKQMDISKPTLVKWNKKYRNEIEHFRRQIFCKNFASFLLENENQIILDTDKLVKYSLTEFKTESGKEAARRAMKRLSKLFIYEMESVTLKLTKTDRLKQITFHFSEPEENEEET